MLSDTLPTSLAIGGWVVAGVLMVAGAAGYLYYSTKLQDLRQLNSALQHTAEQNTLTIQKLTAASHNADRVLLEREKEIEQLRSQTQTIKTEIKEIYVKEPETKNWADTEIPKSIILQLQGEGNNGNNQADTSTGDDESGVDRLRAN